MDTSGVSAAIRRSLEDRTADAADITDWLERIQRTGRFTVEERDLTQLDRWTVDGASGDITHDSGRFFSVRGAHTSIRTVQGEFEWQQPVIVQPDVGVLGLISSAMDGVLKFLVQAKMEPGNRRLVQVSPTVQATSSNFQRIHEGTATPYLSYFQDPSQHRGLQEVLTASLQSEQANRYLHKRNLNSIVVVEPGAVEIVDDRFRWLTLGDLLALAAGDDLVHMDTRSILGSVPFTSVHEPAPAADPGVFEWLAEAAASTHVRTTLIPLDSTTGWALIDGRLTRSGASPFDVIGVRVTASNREVSAWDQPLVRNAPGAGGTLVVRRGPDEVRVLVTAMTGLGVQGSVELGPTFVDWAAGELDAPLHASELELRSAAGAGTVIFDHDLPEEGGRFFHSSTRHRIVEVDSDAVLDVGSTHRWVSLPELRSLARRDAVLNMELRSLIACLPATLRDGS